jgi:hypothetical protein
VESLSRQASSPSDARISPNPPSRASSKERADASSTFAKPQTLRARRRTSAYLRVVGVARRGGGLGACGGRQLLMPISAREVCRAGCRVGAASDGSFQSGARRLPRLRRKRERVKASPVRSGCGELELAQGVESALADLAGDGQSRHGGVAPLAGCLVEGEVGGGCAVRVHGGFNQRPAKMR